MKAPTVGRWDLHADWIRRGYFPLQWFSIGPVLDEDDKVAGLSVFGPRWGLIVYRRLAPCRCGKA